MNKLENVLNSFLVTHFTNTFLSKDSDKKGKYYVSKNCHIFTGYEEVDKIRKIPLILLKIVAFPKVGYVKLSLGYNKLLDGKKFVIYEFKEENGIVVVEVEYKGSLVNLEGELKKVVEEIKKELILYVSSMGDFEKIANPSEEEINETIEEMMSVMKKEEEGVETAEEN